ncbi:hypothetical protein ACNF40_02880 [Cuniculiplasma sp. SKW4]|uniref:hypothetical protein n=1 Tax=Cuniculiplasma sp. SKW4 TaxID=3400171 RepID=UPI003FD3D6D6
MITTMATTEHKEYLEYLDSIYGEVIDFFTAKKEMPDPEKVKFFVSMTARPYFYWEQEKNKPNNEKMSEEAKRNWLQALKKRYGIVESGGTWTISKKLEVMEFKELARKMNEMGFQYDKDRRAFVEGKS